WLVPPRQKSLPQPREEARPDRERVVVEVVVRVVEEAAAFGGAVAEPEHGARARVQHEGEILGPPGRRIAPRYIVGAADLGRHVGGEGGFGGVVYGRRIAAAIVERGGRAMGGGDAAGDLAEPALEQILH